MCSVQIKKTSEATLTTIQDMVTIEDYDVSECFHHSRSTESVKSTVSETYLSKPSIAKRRANQQETEQFYFMVSGVPASGNLWVMTGENWAGSYSLNTVAKIFSVSCADFEFRLTVAIEIAAVDRLSGKYECMLTVLDGCDPWCRDSSCNVS